LNWHLDKGVRYKVKKNVMRGKRKKYGKRRGGLENWGQAKDDWNSAEEEKSIHRKGIKSNPLQLI